MTNDPIFQHPDHRATIAQLMNPEGVSYELRCACGQQTRLTPLRYAQIADDKRAVILQIREAFIELHWADGTIHRIREEHDTLAPYATAGLI